MLRLTDREWADLAKDVMPALTRCAAVYVAAGSRDDLVQDTLVQAWDKRRNFDLDRGTFRAWTMAILRNIAIRRYADTARIVRNASFSTTATVDTEASMDLRRAVDALPPRQREVTILHYYVDRPLTEIADLLELSLGTIKSTLHDARVALAGRLTHDGH